MSVEKVDDIKYTLGRIAGVVDTLSPRMDKFENSTAASFRDLGDKIDEAVKPLVERVSRAEVRITRIETKQARTWLPAGGAGAAVGALAGFLLQHLFGK